MSESAYDRRAEGPPRFRLEDQITSLHRADNDATGFAYEVFEWRKDAGSPQIVIAYRGTEDARDWFRGNFLTQQNGRGLAVFDHWRQRFPDAEIVVTGHSLGGGIATHVSLNRPRATAYVFNTSPRFRQGPERYQNRRYSIVEFGEALKLPRLFGREPDQLYTSVGCSRGTAIRQHGMRLLAECLTQIAAWDHGDARRSLLVNNIPVPTGLTEWRVQRE